MNAITSIATDFFTYFKSPSTSQIETPVPRPTPIVDAAAYKAVEGVNFQVLFSHFAAYQLQFGALPHQICEHSGKYRKLERATVAIADLWRRTIPVQHHGVLRGRDLSVIADFRTCKKLTFRQKMDVLRRYMFDHDGLPSDDYKDEKTGFMLGAWTTAMFYYFGEHYA